MGQLLTTDSWDRVRYLQGYVQGMYDFSNIDELEATE